MLIHLKDFGGLIPKASARSLPPNFAVTADNALLYSGELRGINAAQLVMNLSAEAFTVRRAYRLYDGNTSIADAAGDWVAFDAVDVNFIRGALVNDSFDRYYAAGGGDPPRVDTAANWAAGGGGVDLGVPAPTTAPAVSAPASGTVDETRAYVYTFVNLWGEESAPSPASDVDTGSITGTWALTGMQTAYPVAGTFHTLDKIRIYRTVTGTASVDYRLVEEISVASSYNDTESVDTVSLNESLPSDGWDLPPDSLEGIVNMANGIMAGFSGRDIYFSEPYRPHTMPGAYVLSVDADIVGLGVFQNGLVVCTTSNPYVASGSHPASIVLTKLDEVEPCVSFRSIVNGLNGVTYASSNGLILVNQSGAVNITEPLATRTEWLESFSPSTVIAANDGTRMLAFTSISAGWMFSPNESLGFLVKLRSFTNVVSVQTDPFTGEAYYIANDLVYLWNPPDTAPLSYTWTSKVFELPKPVNMGAYRLQYENVVDEEDFVVAFDYLPYNTDRIGSALNTFNSHAINGVRVVAGMTDSPPVVQNRTPLGGGPLFRTSSVATTQSLIRVRIWGDGVLRYEREISSDQMMRLPSGYKADKWQVSLQTSQRIYSFKLAGTAKELEAA